MEGWVILKKRNFLFITLSLLLALTLYSTAFASLFNKNNSIRKLDSSNIETGIMIYPKNKNIYVSGIQSKLTLPKNIYVPDGDGSYSNWFLKLYRNLDDGSSIGIETGISYSKTKSPNTPWRNFGYLRYTDNNGNLNVFNLIFNPDLDKYIGSAPMKKQPKNGDTVSINVYNEKFNSGKVVTSFYVNNSRLYSFNWNNLMNYGADETNRKLTIEELDKIKKIALEMLYDYEICSEFTSTGEQVTHSPVTHSSLKYKKGSKWYIWNLTNNNYEVNDIWQNDYYTYTVDIKKDKFIGELP